MSATSENRAKAIVDNYKERLKEITNIDKNHPIVLNNEWENITDRLDIVYCGDNPGLDEKEASLYFVGTAGENLKPFVDFTNYHLRITEHAYFNKTPVHSVNTKDIKFNAKCAKSVVSSIQLTIECIFRLWQNNRNLKIIVLGYSESYIVTTFQKNLTRIVAKHPAFKSSIYVLSHPSRFHLYTNIGRYFVNQFSNKSHVTLNFDEMLNHLSKKDWLTPEKKPDSKRSEPKPNKRIKLKSKK